MCPPGGTVPEGWVDHDVADVDPVESAGSGQGMVQHPGDQLGGVPDL